MQGDETNIKLLFLTMYGYVAAPQVHAHLQPLQAPLLALEEQQSSNSDNAPNDNIWEALKEAVEMAIHALRQVR